MCIQVLHAIKNHKVDISPSIGINSKVASSSRSTSPCCNSTKMIFIYNLCNIIAMTNAEW